MWVATVRDFIFIALSFFSISDGILDKRQHQTNASLEKMNDLTCFQCNSINTGEKCSNLSLHNKTEFRQKCKGDKRKCMVKRYSYTTSTGNSTSHVKMWSLERSCTNKCEEGCIIIGERTKLHACTACCTDNLCNFASYGISIRQHINELLFITSILFPLNESCIMKFLTIFPT